MFSFPYHCRDCLEDEAGKELSAASTSLSGAFGGNVTAAANFKNALADLKKLVPELKAELDALATTDGIDAAYQKAVGSARTMGEVMSATDLANRAKSIVKFGKHDNILDLIASVESGGDYNATLDNGRWTGGAQNLTGMTLNQVRALQKQMLADPATRKLFNARGWAAYIAKDFDRTAEALGTDKIVYHSQMMVAGARAEYDADLLRQKSHRKSLRTPMSASKPLSSPTHSPEPKVRQRPSM